ncbi:MAG: serine/threonine protein kinase, partial [Deltaproteobacteria bacterium]
MSDPLLPLPDTEVAEVDEAARRRFEADWAAGAPGPIEGYLPDPSAATWLPTLEELVHIDLELRWRHRDPGSTAPLAEAWLDRFEALRVDPAIAGRVLEQECLVRLRLGDPPRLDEYRRRFPTLVAAGSAAEAILREALGGDDDGGDAIGRYRVLGEHARGGFGRVYRAEDPPLQRVVALKRLDRRVAGDPELQARFVAEARVTARLDHPGVVPVYELGEDDDGPYYAMKLARGRTLAEVLHATRRGDPLARSTLVRLFSSLARTVAYAHDQGVVHRDLKPANALVGDYGETFLLDWGIAKDAGATAPDRQADGGQPQTPGATRAGTRLGT